MTVWQKTAGRRRRSSGKVEGWGSGLQSLAKDLGERGSPRVCICGTRVLPGGPRDPCWSCVVPLERTGGQVLLEDFSSGARHRVVLLALAEL